MPQPFSQNTRSNFDIIIGYRKREYDTLKMVLESFHNQDFDRNLYNIIVVEQDEILHKPESLNDRIKWIFAYNRGPYNRGWGFNIGFKNSSSDILILHDADLIVRPDFIKNVFKGLKESGKHAVRTYEKIEFLDNGGKVYREMFDSFGGSTACTRELYKEVNGHNELYEGWGWEDFDFARRCGEKRWYRCKNVVRHLWHGYDSTAPEDKLKNSKRNEHIFKSRLFSTEEIGDINKYGQR